MEKYFSIFHYFHLILNNNLLCEGMHSNKLNVTVREKESI